MKTKKKVVSFLLAVFLVAGFLMIPGEKAKAEGPATMYGLWFDGQQFTSDWCVMNVGGGTATFDPENSVLTLENVNFNRADSTNEYNMFGIIQSNLPQLTIVLNGDNSLTGKSGEYYDAINADAGCDVTITGEGSLAINNTYYGIYAGQYGDGNGNILINGTEVNVNNTAATGIWANENLTISGSDVTVDRQDMDSYHCLVSNEQGAITISDSNVDLRSKKQAVHMGNGGTGEHRFVLESGQVNIYVSDQGEYGYGIKVEPIGEVGDPELKGKINGTITINGGVLDIQATEGGTNVAEENVTIAKGLVFLPGERLEDPGHVVVRQWPFSDVKIKPGKWNYEGIRYCYLAGVMTGDADSDNDGITTFRPHDALTRGQYVTMLYRMDGGTDVTGYANPFTDVKKGKYYYNAVVWALHEGLTTGTSDTTFEPEKAITRQEMATFLMRFANYYNIDTSEKADISAMPDYNRVKAFAKDAMAWAYQNGIITGKEVKGSTVVYLAPRDLAEREQAAAIMQRFMQKWYK